MDSMKSFLNTLTIFYLIYFVFALITEAFIHFGVLPFIIIFILNLILFKKPTLWNK